MPRTQDPNDKIDPKRQAGARIDDGEPDGDEARIGRAHLAVRDVDDDDGDEPLGRAHTERNDDDDDDDDDEHGIASRPMDLPFTVRHAREEDDEEELGQDELLAQADVDDLDLDDDDELEGPTRERDGR